MANTIFCTNCGAQLTYTISSCTCGYSMSTSEKNEIYGKLQTVDNFQFIDSSQGKLIAERFNQLEEYKLDRTYFRGSSAKKAYERKSHFIQKSLIPNVNSYAKTISEAEKILAIDKVEVYGKIVNITDFVLKEFFGPLAVKDNNLQCFIEFSDFGKYELSETIVQSNLDFSDIKTTNFGSIGNNIMSSVGRTLENGSFKELSKKDHWSESDIKTVKAEVGIAIAAEAINGALKMMEENSQVINDVRVADEKLNDKLSQISNVFNSLTIEEKELAKQKRLFDTAGVTLDSCFEKNLKPIMEELKKDAVYIKYSKERKQYDLKQEKIKIDNEVNSTSVDVSFWSCVLFSARYNYKRLFKKRLKKVEKLEEYVSINSTLKEGFYSTLLELQSYHKLETEKFIEFEKINRRELKRLPVIANNQNVVRGFVPVLKTVRTNLNQ
ncbi:hypothetical protein HCG49_02340 [Arenibacter sp. 6A1]|uniref:hypothetical protein n=1 Tax=Arenibacter sp. 6A1 TaxID=2720391 RepID=UPI00144543DA|nr:hypothetical protein [Arenibacter sp. 6A1]NKI25396.1 hypothetical protein [Arenibacter sp. 6A1]